MQATETLGHYAEWLDVRATPLRELNRMRLGTPVVIGQRLKIDTSRVSTDEFDQRRRGYTRSSRRTSSPSTASSAQRFMSCVEANRSWVIAQRYQNLPIWLLRQYNPDVDFDDVRPRTELTLPLVETTAPRQPTFAGSRHLRPRPSPPMRGIPSAR